MRVLTDGITQRRTITLAIVLAVGTLTKVSGVTLVPLVGLALIIHGWRTGNWKPILLTGALIGRHVLGEFDRHHVSEVLAFENALRPGYPLRRFREQLAGCSYVT